MTVPDRSWTVNLAGQATGFVANIQAFYHGKDFVEVSEVPQGDLAACAEGRFVPPGGPWEGAVGKLGFFRALILTGLRGTGRRTAALGLLSRIGVGGPIYELVPTWEQPSTGILPPLRGARCLLDLSEPTEKPPPDDFGKKLLDWARQNDLVLVAIAADETGAKRWAGSAGNAVVPLQSPNARKLAASELGLTEAGKQRAAILDDLAFTEIWQSAPKVVDVRRLVELITEKPFRTPEQIVDEYRGWRKWIAGKFSEKRIGPRTLMWAAAFCDGGQRESVLRMSEDLRRRLNEDRGPAAILSDDPASKRLTDAELDPDSDRALFDSSLHGIAEALRVYLWREFEDPPLRALLTEWLISQLGELPTDDTERLARGVLDIVVRFRDDTLLRGVRDKLTGGKQPIAARLLSKAAVDPQFGAHVRSSLYNWAKDSRSQADLVATVCGGEFGGKMPGLALVRLGWAAQNSGPDSTALTDALVSIAARHPVAVLESIAKWIDDKDRATAGINAFLALASTNTGAALFCDRAESATGLDGFRERLIYWFQRAAAESDTSYQATMSVYQMWQKLSDNEVISSRVAIPVLGRGIEPALGKNPMRRLYPGFPDMDSFWNQVFTIAIRGEEAIRATDFSDDPVTKPNAPVGQTPKSDRPPYEEPPVALAPEVAPVEADTLEAPFPSPEVSAWPDPTTALSLPPGPQTTPGLDISTDARVPVVPGPPADAETDANARPD